MRFTGCRNQIFRGSGGGVPVAAAAALAAEPCKSQACRRSDPGEGGLCTAHRFTELGRGANDYAEKSNQGRVGFTIEELAN
jgi:hypothetical protein